MKFLLDLFLDNWIIIAPILYEMIARIWPTKWNISILDNIWKFINLIIPNKRIPDGTEKTETNSRGQLINRVKVKIGKHILRSLLITVLFSGNVDAQIWQNFKGVRLVNNSDSTAQLAIQGSIYYDDLNDTFWGRDNWGWKRFGGSGIDGTLIANRIPYALDANTLTSSKVGYSETVTALQFFTPSVDGADNEVFVINSGGSGGASLVRGAYIALSGNEALSTGGEVNIISGNLGGFNISGTLDSDIFVTSGDLSIRADTTIFHNGTGEKISVDGNLTRIVFTSDAQRVSYISHSSIDNTLNIGRGGTNLIIINNDNMIIMPALPTVTPCGTAPSGTIWSNANILTVCP